MFRGDNAEDFVPGEIYNVRRGIIASCRITSQIASVLRGVRCDAGTSRKPFGDWHRDSKAKELVEEEAENLTEGLTEEFSGDFPKKLHPRD
jgi:hypothetical protein